MKKSLVLLVLVVQFSFFTGCWSSREIGQLAISVCMGIDKTEKGYMVSQQIISPKVVASNKEVDESPIVVYSAEGKSIEEAKSSLSTSTSREIYGSHLRMIILSEEVARDGVLNIMDYLLRYPEYRTDYMFAIAKGISAKDLLGVLTPFEAIPGIFMFDKLRLSDKTWAPIKATNIIELTNDIMAYGKNPVVVGIEIKEGSKSTKTTEDLKYSSDIRLLEYKQMGAFKDDKLIGWLSEDESKGLNYITGDVTTTVGHLEYQNEDVITVDVSNAKSTIKIKLENEKPKANVLIKLDYNVTELESDLDLTKSENTELLNKLLEDKLKNICKLSVKKAQMDLKSDIFGFGEAVHRKYPAFWKKVKESWDDEFSDMPVKIAVQAKLKNTGDISKALKIKD